MTSDLDRRVFILEPMKHDLSDACRFGDLVYIYSHDERRPSMWTNAFKEDCMSRLEQEQFDHERDYFLVGGPTTPVTLIVVHLVLSFDTLNLLLFDSASSEYRHQMIT